MQFASTEANSSMCWHTRGWERGCLGGTPLSAGCREVWGKLSLSPSASSRSLQCTRCLGGGFPAALQVTAPVWCFKKALREQRPVSGGFGTGGKPLCGSVLMTSGFPYIWHPFFSIFPPQKSLGDDAAGVGDAQCHLFSIPKQRRDSV